MAEDSTISPPGKLSIMLVDADLYGLRDMQRYAMNHPGLEVAQASKTGRGALNFFKHEEADLLIINPALPDVNGFDLIATLPKRPRIIVVADRPDYAYFAYQVGAMDYLLKPLPHPRLDQLIERIQTERAMRQELLELRQQKQEWESSEK